MISVHADGENVLGSAADLRAGDGLAEEVRIQIAAVVAVARRVGAMSVVVGVVAGDHNEAARALGRSRPGRTHHSDGRQ